MRFRPRRTHAATPTTLADQPARVTRTALNLTGAPVWVHEHDQTKPNGDKVHGYLWRCSACGTCGDDTTEWHASTLNAFDWPPGVERFVVQRANAHAHGCHFLPRTA